MQVAAAVDKAVRGANLNLNPQIIEPTLVKVAFPKYAALPFPDVN
jgi:ribosome recycling factor